MATRLIGALILHHRLVDGETRFSLFRGLRVEGEGFDFQIPPGAETNGGNIPRALWWLIHPHGKLLPAFLLHDYLIARRGRLPGGRAHPRIWCDNRFREACQGLGLNWRQSVGLFLGVRLGALIALLQTGSTWGHPSKLKAPPHDA